MKSLRLARNATTAKLNLRLSILLVVALSGCSGGDQPATQPVTGSVKFTDGTPVKGATVRFRTTDRIPPFTASGTTDDQGIFRLDAAEGENAAVIAPSVPRDTDEMTPAERDRALSPFDPMFLDYGTSKLVFHVTNDASKNAFEIKVWPPRR